MVLKTTALNLSLVKQQRGVALVMAMFIIVVMAAAIALMQQFQSTQTATTDFSIQRARALAAADSGLEWLVYQVKHHEMII